MNWFKRHFGLDFVDVAIQFTVTAIIMAAIDSTVHGPSGERTLFLVAGASVLLFGFRRQTALKKQAAEPIGLDSGQMAAARLEELEQRVSQLESAEARVVELEERLDFTERLLAQHAIGSGAVAGAGDAHQRPSIGPGR